MRNTGTRGYYGYRGRRPNGRKWLVLVLVLIILAAVAFLFAQRYLVYDMDGSYHFELPWFRRAQTDDAQQTAQPGQTGQTGKQTDLEIIIEEPEPPEVLPLHAQELDVSSLQNGMSRILETLPEDVNAVAIRLKNSDGDLLYPSLLPDATDAKAVSGSAISRSIIDELTDSDYYTIARLSTLHDSRFSFAHPADAAIQQKKYKGYVWYAPDSTFYLAPEKEMARQYLVNIASEVAALGFDELLFDEFGYPPAGRLNNILTANRGMTQEEALSLLADNLREALSDTDVVLSLTMDAQTVLSGSNAKTGQNLADLAVRFDRIYVPAAEEQLPELQAALEPYPAELVPILETAPAEGIYLISVMS